jgi:hypothetical protein
MYVRVRVTYPSLPFGADKQDVVIKKKKTTPKRKVRTGRESRLSAVRRERELKKKDAATKLK